MKVVSVNIGARQKVRWRLKTVETGIFKSPVDKISLGEHDVVNDQVVNRKYHGGVDKACYLFSADCYDEFKALYPKLDWNWGMFGENITISGLNESEIFIGSRYQIGTAVIEVSEPRQPCSKLGIRFKNQRVLKDFIRLEHSGVYVRVILSGEVSAGDKLDLISKGSEISIRDVFRMIYRKEESQEKIKATLALESLALSTKKDIKKVFKI